MYTQIWKRTIKGTLYLHYDSTFLPIYDSLTHYLNINTSVKEGGGDSTIKILYLVGYDQVHHVFFIRLSYFLFCLTHNQH